MAGYLFVDRFNARLESANGLQARREVVRQHAKVLIDRHNAQIDDYLAIFNAIKAHGLDPGGADYRKLRETYRRLAQEQKDDEDVHADTSDDKGHRDKKRRHTGDRARKQIVALWSYKRLAHYGWSRDLPAAALGKLRCVATKYPDWERFVEIVNCVMIDRHESSLALNQGDRRIGRHSSSSRRQDPRSPVLSVEIANIKKLDERSTATVLLSSTKIDRFLRLCQCRKDDDCNPPLRDWALEYDEFHMLVPKPPLPQGQTVCDACKQHGLDQQTNVGHDSGSQEDGMGAADELDTVPDPGLSGPQHPPAPPPCPACHGPCELCVVPGSMDHAAAEESYAAAHDWKSIGGKSPHSTDGTAKLRWANMAPSTVDGQLAPDADGLLFHGDPKTSDISQSGILECFTVIRGGHFPDAGDYSREWAADALVNRFDSGTKLDVRIDDSPGPVLREVHHIARRLRESEDQSPVLNVLGLGEFSKAIAPGLTRARRCTLLDTIISRLKSNRSNVVRKQVIDTPGDVASCMAFHILGFRGAYSGTHVDALGGTWLRVLFGARLWWFVPSPTDEDWAEFAEHGHGWIPGERARVVLLKQGDVLYMPAGTIHAVLTLETSLATGGMIWDEGNLLATLQLLERLEQHPNCTNEPHPYQLPSVLEELRQYIQTRPMGPQHDEIETAINKLLKSGCKCTGQCKYGCSCKANGRRCLSWCSVHPSFFDDQPSKGRKRNRECMSE